MSDKSDGGPAFPSSPHFQQIGLSQHFYEGAYGMSLRDYFAAKALPVVFANFLTDGSAWDGYPDVAESAYRIADAMLAERAK